jgi:hypothetical protein
LRIADITSNPVTARVAQCARNISMKLAEQTNPVKFLIRDRDAKFAASFDAVFAAESTRIIKTPVQAPRSKAICERGIRTMRRDCLDRTLILRRRHLQAVLGEYVEHHNSHRPHRSLRQRPPAASDVTLPAIGDVETSPDHEEPTGKAAPPTNTT